MAVLLIPAALAFLGGCTHARRGGVTDYSHWRPDYKIRHETLANGLTVLYVEDHSVPVVNYTTWFKVGSAWEKAGATGVAHLFEHMMFKGTPRFPAKKFFENLESKGAIVNAFTQRNATVYFETIPARHLELVIDMESDRLAHLAFTQKDLDSERQVVKEERRLRVDSSFGEQQLEALDRLAFPTHPYGSPVIGYMEDLDRLTLAQCRDFFDTYYQPGNAIVTIAGDFDYDEARGLMRKYYGPIVGHGVPELLLRNEKVAPVEKRLVIRKPVESESLLMGYYIPSMYDGDVERLSMLAWSLFGMSSSRGRLDLVRQKQLALNVSADAHLERFPYLFIISAEMRQGEESSRAEAEIDRLIESAKSDPLSEAELDRVKNGLIYTSVNELKSPAGIASWLTFGEFYWNDRDKVFDKLATYEAMRPEDLQLAARRYLTKENRVVVVMKPEKSR